MPDFSFGADTPGLGPDDGQEGREKRAANILGAISTDAAGLGALGQLLNAWSEMGRHLAVPSWGVADAKHDFSRMLDMARSKPQFIADKKSPSRSVMVMLDAGVVDNVARVIEALATPRHASGAEMARMLSHDGEPTAMARLPRKASVRAARRALPGGSRAPDPELRPLRERAGDRKTGGSGQLGG